MGKNQIHPTGMKVNGIAQQRATRRGTFNMPPCYVRSEAQTQNKI